MNDESQPKWDFCRKAGAPAFHHVDGQMGVLPEFKLVSRHVKGAPMNVTEQNIAGTHPEFTQRVTHGRGPITATAALMKHHLSVILAQAVDDRPRVITYVNSSDHGFQKKPIGFLSKDINTFFVCR
jgi:hypothetical protein